MTPLGLRAQSFGIHLRYSMETALPSVILCVDMDAFFASVEQQVNPRLRGKPVAVIGSSSRTVVVTRSYEARRYGVKTGMTVYEARRVCPHLIFVVGDSEKYTHTCTELAAMCRQFTPDVEIYSVDEAFLDITTTHHLFGGPLSLGSAIKAAVKERFGINCTVGIGPNILIAKLVSDLSKPDGLRWVRLEEVAAILEDLPVDELWGISSGIKNRLATMEIRTCGELGRAPVSVLRNKFGIIGETLSLMGKGLCDRSLIVRPEDPKSIGHSWTLPQDVYDRKRIESYLLQLSEMVGRRARKYRFTGRRVTLTIRYPDFETFTRQATLPQHTNATHVIYETVLRTLDGIRLRDKVRLIGVSLSELIKEPTQLSLVRDKARDQALHSAMDAINDRFGDFKITWASYLPQIEVPSVIAPAWKPSGVRNIHVRNRRPHSARH